MKNNKLLLALLIIPALSACDIFSPHKDKSNSYSDNTSITSISETSTDITSEDINSNSDNSGQSSESSNDQQEEYPTYPVTVEENPEVIWDDSQKSQRTGNKVIDFYNINDIHGIVDESGNYAGIAKISSFLKESKQANKEGYVFTSSGDTWQGSADSNLTYGGIMNSWLEYNDCSAMALGNHEFDWTIDVLRENDKKTKFPLLACNIIHSDTYQPVNWARPYTTITRNGLNIGIIGAIGEGITKSILASNVKGLTFDNPLKYVKTWSNYLKERGADVILFLYHGSTEELNEQYSPYVDGIFGGHNHRIEENEYDGIPALEGACYGQAVAHISLTYDYSLNKVTSRSGEIIRSNTLTSYSKDTGTLELIESFQDIIEEIKNEKIAHIDYSISGNELITLAEKYMYRFFDEYTNSSVKLYSVRHNQARQSLNAGDITYGDVYAAFPFDNQLVLTTCNYLNVNEYSYTSYYPNGEDASILKDENNNVYILTIDYLSQHQSYGQYLTEVEVYAGIFVRDLFKKYMKDDYPLH